MARLINFFNKIEKLNYTHALKRLNIFNYCQFCLLIKKLLNGSINGR